MTPPPWTCPAIDRCAHAVRSARWRVKYRGWERAATLAALDTALRELEVVRAENAAMRAYAGRHDTGTEEQP